MKKIFKALIQKWKDWDARIPRRAKVMGYVLASLLMGFLIYIFIGAPTWNWEHRYRRIEKAHFVGPAEILGYEEVCGMLYDEVVLAKTQDAVIVSSISLYETGNDVLLYLTKTGKVTVTAALQDPKRSQKSEKSLTVFVVDDYPEAAYVELDLHLGNAKVYTQSGYRPSFYLSAERQTNGYFRVDIPLEQWSEYSQEQLSLMLFNAYSMERERYDIPARLYEADVRFYDGSGQLIAEESLYLFEE